MTEQIRIDAACACKTGLVRSNNEDNFYFAGHILDRKNSGLEDGRHRSVHRPADIEDFNQTVHMLQNMNTFWETEWIDLQ